jgi:putative flippase GtrA
VTREALAFILVGLTALTTHWLVLVAFVSAGGLHPLAANVLGFAVAFNVSYLGHRHLTFAVRDRSHRRTLPRFLGVAVSMFLINQIFYWVLLTFSALRYDVANLIVLVTVAAVTFLLSKFWAFA